jgi:hypothetical protein
MKIYQAVQKVLVGDRQTGDLISLLSFLESRLITNACKNKTDCGVLVQRFDEYVVLRE